MSTREVRWLEREVKVWEREGLVDAATVERLTARYAAEAAIAAKIRAPGSQR